MRILLTIVPFFLLTGAVAQPANRNLVISHLKGDFYVYTTYAIINKKPFPANGMYVVTTAGVVMLDTPWDTTQFKPLLDSIKVKHNKPVILAIATHSHADRTAGLKFLQEQGVKTYTTKYTDAISRERNGVRAQFVFKNDTTFNVGQYTLRTHYPGKGHTADNIVIWFNKEKILYGGCLIKSVEAADIGNVADADVTEWKKTIKKVKQKYPNPTYIIPGHQSWDNINSLNHTLKLIRDYRNRL